MAFRSASTATYTFASGSTGSTVDLGANNNYRYINATNVYNKGKSDGGGDSIGDIKLEHGYYLFWAPGNTDPDVSGPTLLWKKLPILTTNTQITGYPMSIICFTTDITALRFFNENWNNPETHYIVYCSINNIVKPIASQAVSVGTRKQVDAAMNTNYDVLYFSKTSSIQLHIIP